MMGLSNLQKAILVTHANDTTCLKILINTYCKSVIQKSGEPWDEAVNNIIMEVKAHVLSTTQK